MSKYRLYDIAKELNITNKALMERLPELGIQAKSHSSTVVESDYIRLKENIAKSTPGAKKVDPVPDDPDAQKKRLRKPKDGDRPITAQAQDNNAQENADDKAKPALPEGITRDAHGRLVRPDGTVIPPKPRPLPEGVTRNAQGQLVRPDGTIIPPRPLPEGVTRNAHGQLVRPDGTIIPPRPRPLPEGVTRNAQGQLVRPDGTVIPPRPRPPLPEGVTRNAQGQLVRPDGTILPPRRPLPEGVTRNAQGQLVRADGTLLPPRRPLPEGVTRNAQGQLVRADGTILPPRRPRPDFDRGDRPPYQQRPGGQGQGYDGQRRPRPEGGFRPGGPQGQGQREWQPRPGGPYQGSRDGRPGQFGDRRGPGGPGGPGGQRPGGFTPRPGAAGQSGGGRFVRPGAGGHDKAAKPAAAPDKSERLRNLEAHKSHRKDRPIVDESRGGRPGRGGKVTPQKPAPRGGRPMPRSPISLEPKNIVIPSLLTVKELAEKMGVSGAELVKSLIKQGHMIGINNEITYDLAAEIALSYNIIAEEFVETDIFEDVFGEAPEDDSVKEARPPVVVVMGHVDHGKTSLLDAIRNTSVTKGEQGGITQHIGAYTVSINDKPITFLDTPGHEAFTAMRMRGAQVTDVAVLVVAADDGVMPQTIEAISHAKAAGVEIIVAINKMDKPSANPDRVKQELTEHALVTEEWGGETICVPVSAAQQTGIDTLLEMIILVAEMKELKANPNKRARGVVIEALLDKGRGSVARVLVQEGTMDIGDHVISGAIYGKVRAMIDDKGKRVKKAGPSMPVEILGLPGVPGAGDMFYVAESEKQARAVADTYYARGRRDMTRSQVQKVSLDDLFNQIQEGKVKELGVIIKADVAGSVEALRQSLEKLSSDEVRIKTILGNVGAITESDVSLASASNAIIIGFNVRPEVSAKAMAEEQSVDIRLYRVIYSAIEDIQQAMRGLLDPVFEEKTVGKAEIRQLFKASGIGTIGGSYILDGKFIRNASVRIIRDGIVVYEGGLDSLRRFKDDVREVNAGYECGLVFERFNDIKTGDIVEAYVMEEIKR